MHRQSMATINIPKRMPSSVQIVKSAFYCDSFVASRTIGKQQRLTTSFPTSQFQFKTLRALSAAPFTSTYSPENHYLVGAEQFFEENPLIAATLKPVKQTKYAIALEHFVVSRVVNEANNLFLDQRVAMYIHKRHSASPKAG